MSAEPTIQERINTIHDHVEQLKNAYEATKVTAATEVTPTTDDLPKAPGGGKTQKQRQQKQQQDKQRKQKQQQDKQQQGLFGGDLFSFVKKQDKQEVVAGGKTRKQRQQKQQQQQDKQRKQKQQQDKKHGGEAVPAIGGVVSAKFSDLAK